jgi:hypothetical protein
MVGETDFVSGGGEFLALLTTSKAKTTPMKEAKIKIF